MSLRRAKRVFTFRGEILFDIFSQVKFTCNVCDTTNIKRVSPRGWNAGTVLARCDGCEKVHKLIDNLKVFHELKGEPHLDTVYLEPSFLSALKHPLETPS